MTLEQYRDFIKEIQNSLDEDDSVFQIARDILSNNKEVKEFLENILCENNPINRLMNDLY